MDPIPSFRDCVFSASSSFSLSRVVIEVATESTDALDFGSGDITTSQEQVMASNRVRGFGGLRAGCAVVVSGVFS